MVRLKMRPTDNIHKLIKKLHVKAGPELDQRVHNDISKALAESKQIQPAATQPNIWRIIMKNKTTKLATAAAVILIAILGITVLDKTTTPVWAIDETIDLLREFNGIHFSGTMLDEQGKEVYFEAWARANEDQTASNHLRLETKTGEIDVVSGHRRYQYDPATQTVKITEGYGPAIRPWPGAQMLETLKKMTLDWNQRYGKDPATGRDRVFVTCSHPAVPEPRSWWFEFDIESTLLVSMKQWPNMTRKGAPSFYAKSIIYFEDLPDEMFHFEIPEGARTVPALTERNDKLQDPNSGMLIGNMTEEQACEEIVHRYWQAIIEHDWQTAALLYPIATAQEWENKYSGSRFEEIVEIKEPHQEEEYTIVPCTIRFDSNFTRTINTTVVFRTIDGQQSCVISSTWSQGLDQNADVK
jgi:hypothetical protein